MKEARCGWNVIGSECRQSVEFIYVYPTGEAKPFCKYHAGIARRDGWNKVGRLSKIKTASA
jgi:hypothetical protein